MSEQSKRARAERRAAPRETISTKEWADGMYPELPDEPAPEPEELAHMFGIYITPGEGWRMIEADVARGDLRNLKVSEPDIQGVTMGRLEMAIEAEVARRSGW